MPFAHLLLPAHTARILPANGADDMSLPALPFFFIYMVLNASLCWHDVRTGLLPNRLTCPLLWSGLLFQLCLNPTADVVNALWGALAGYGFMAFLYWVYRGIRNHEGLGYGDVKYLAALGAWHGWHQLPGLLLTASVMASAYIVGVACYRHSVTEIKNPLPFGPFLGAAGFIMAGMSAFSLQP